MGQDTGISGGNFTPLFELDVAQPTLDESLSLISTSDVNLNDPNLRPALSTIIDGLNNSSKSISCSDAILSLYENCPGDAIQAEIMIRLAWSENSPILEDLVYEILSDTTENSLSREFDDVDKQQIIELIKTPPENRANLLLKYIEQQNGQSGATQQSTDEPITPMRLSEYYSAQSPEGKEHSGEGPLPPEVLMQHLMELAKSNTPDFLNELNSQMQNSPEFGRQIGNLINQHDEFRNEMTRAVIKTMTQHSENPTIVRNSLSYFHQVGEDTVIPLMNEDQKAQYIPRLLGKDTHDQLAFAKDDLLCRVEKGEEMTLSTLGQEGPVAIPVLWKIRFGNTKN